MKRRTLLSLLVLGGVAAAGVVACGDDATNAGAAPAGPDASVDAPASAPADAAAPVDAGPLAASISVYYGSVAKLAASDPGATYAWAITKGPDGSTATLADGTTATPSFVPDRLGRYELSISSGARTGLVTVDVVDPSIFYVRTEVDGGVLAAATFNVVGAGFGDGGTAVGCFTRDAGAYGVDVPYASLAGMDSWEGRADEPAKLVYLFETREDGGSNGALFAATSRSTCADAPAKLDELAGNLPSSRALDQPKISPSGARVAYIRSLPQGATLSTVGLDGSGRRDLAPYYALADGGGAPDASTSPVPNAPTYRPRWMTDTRIAWTQATGSTWQIATVNDEPGAIPSVLMVCPGTGDAGIAAMPDELALLASGDVLVSQYDGKTNNLFVYTPDAARNCTNRRALTTFDETTTTREFALSPDGTRIALEVAPAGKPLEIRVLTLDGTVVSTLPVMGSLTTGPHWAGNGAFLSWPTDVSAFFDASAGGGGFVLAVARADGGALHPATIATPSAGVTTVVLGVGNGFCAMGRGYAPGAMLFGMLGVVALRLARRKQRR